MSVTLRFSAAETWVVEVTVLDPDNEPLDLGGSALAWRVGVTEAGGSTLYEATDGNGITIVDAAAGRADIIVPPVARPDLPAGEWFHEFRVLMPSGQIYVPFSGALIVRKTLFD